MQHEDPDLAVLQLGLGMNKHIRAVRDGRFHGITGDADGEIRAGRHQGSGEILAFKGLLHPHRQARGGGESKGTDGQLIFLGFRRNNVRDAQYGAGRRLRTAVRALIRTNDRARPGIGWIHGKRHLALRSETPLGLVTETEYDGFGNATKSVTKGSGDPRFVQTSTAYTADGNYAESVTDARGKTTHTKTDGNRGLTLSATDAAGQTVTYQYDSADRITRAETTADGKTYRNAYTYEKDRLATVSHNTTGGTPDVTYTFGTDPLGNQTTVKVGNQQLSENHYSATGDKLLRRVDYGNGGAVRYTYDSFKRMSGIRYDSAATPRFIYEYGANGAVGRVKDGELRREARMAYDTAERPVEAELYEDGALTYRLTQEYDRYEQPIVLRERVEEPDDTRSEYIVTAEYDKESRPTSLTYTSARMRETGTPDQRSRRKLTYAYDGLGRVKKRGFHVRAADMNPAFESEYTYLSGGYGLNSATALVREIRQAGSKREYWYDTLGNITRECRQGKALISGEKVITPQEVGFEGWQEASYGLSFEGQPLAWTAGEPLMLDTAEDVLLPLTSEADEPLTANVETVVWPPVSLQLNEKQVVSREICFEGQQDASYELSFGEQPLTWTAGEPLGLDVRETVWLPLTTEEDEPLTAEVGVIVGLPLTTAQDEPLGKQTTVKVENQQLNENHYDAKGERRPFFYPAKTSW